MPRFSVLKHADNRVLIRLTCRNSGDDHVVYRENILTSTADNLRTWKILHLSFPSPCGGTVQHDQNIYTQSTMVVLSLVALVPVIISIYPLDLYEIEGTGNLIRGRVGVL